MSGPVQAWRGWAGMASYGLVGWGMSWQAWPVQVWLGRQGEVGRGEAGEAWRGRSWHGQSGPGAAGLGRRGSARLGAVRLDEARLGRQGMKKCSKCGRTKLSCYFDKWRTYCKECRRKHDREAWRTMAAVERARVCVRKNEQRRAKYWCDKNYLERIADKHTAQYIQEGMWVSASKGFESDHYIVEVNGIKRDEHWYKNQLKEI